MSERVISSMTVPWVPVEHRFDLMLGATLPPLPKITSAFVFLVDEAQRTLLAHVGGDRSRGWDVPGGHVDPSESAHQTAVREVAEETGYRLDEADLTLLGWQRITLLAPAPAGYRYPDLAHLVIFTARVDGIGPPTTPPVGSECSAAAWMTRCEVERVCAERAWLVLHRAAFNAARLGVDHGLGDVTHRRTRP